MEYCAKRSLDQVLAAGRSNPKVKRPCQGLAGAWMGRNAVHVLRSILRCDGCSSKGPCCVPCTTQAAQQLTWTRLLSMALDAARGMLYLHTRPTPIAHRCADLKRLLA